MIQGVRTALLVLLAAVAGVLLIACINVAGLLLARGLSRRRDVAVRIALGASRGRVVAHLLAESVLISIAGGAGGPRASPRSPCRCCWPSSARRCRGPTRSRSTCASSRSRSGWRSSPGVVFGLVPALQSSRVDVREALNEAGRSGMGGGVWQRRARAALVIVEIAVTVVLTIGAALLIRSFAPAAERLARLRRGACAGRRGAALRARSTRTTSCGPASSIA